MLGLIGFMNERLNDCAIICIINVIDNYNRERLDVDVGVLLPSVLVTGTLV